ncbi:hypothetical protein KCP69_25625 [Salmonella enterica subsp. enterica]|nr:hypothetical protein KCP69_25625 [Salmonella enterica subsp. enterica]
MLPLIANAGGAAADAPSSKSVRPPPRPTRILVADATTPKAIHQSFLLIAPSHAANIINKSRPARPCGVGFYFAAHFGRKQTSLPPGCRVFAYRPKRNKPRHAHRHRIGVATNLCAIPAPQHYLQAGDVACDGACWRAIKPASRYLCALPRRKVAPPIWVRLKRAVDFALIPLPARESLSDAPPGPPARDQQPAENPHPDRVI